MTSKYNFSNNYYNDIVKLIIHLLYLNHKMLDVGGLLLRRRPSKQKHFWQDDMHTNITRRYMPKLQLRKLRHNDAP
jgi:hypothetical protein